MNALGSLLSQIQPPTRRKVFVSYHHGGDQQYYDAFTNAFAETYDVVFDNSLERRIDSDNVDYVLQRIRDSFISGSSCTIVFCGQETPWRKYVDWEIKATLDMEHGLLGVNLPTNRANATGKVTVPSRLCDNIQSGYAVWTNWAAFAASAQSVKPSIEQAVGRSSKLIVNNRPMMARNGTPPWQS
ncbi:MAG: TIR domain-containing protein [Verrucomicrobia bacterium]|nr:TIR domain-containing protein [Verrucomicrobiota bacterium]